MTRPDKFQKFWVQIAFNAESGNYTINRKPAHHRDETITTEPHFFFGDRRFDTDSEGQSKAERLFGELSWKRREGVGNSGACRFRVPEAMIGQFPAHHSVPLERCLRKETAAGT